MKKILFFIILILFCGLIISCDEEKGTVLGQDPGFLAYFIGHVVFHWF